MKKLFVSSNIITMTKEKCIAILVENGKIIKLLNDLNCEYDELIDLKDACLLPGFIDAHSHIIAVTKSLMMTDLSDNTSINSIIDEFSERLQKETYSDQKWLLGYGYDNYNFADRKHPTNHDLDKISKDIPILISHISGHCGILNTRALELLNITKEINSNGNIGINPVNELNGYIAEEFFIDATKKIPHIKFDDIIKSYPNAEKEYLKNGITTIQESLIYEEEMKILKYLADNKSLNVDIVGYVGYEKSKDLLLFNKQYFKSYINHFKIAGYKLFLDGSPQLKTAYMNEPYDNTDNYYGTKLLSRQQLNNIVKECYLNKIQLVAHCNGDAAIDQYINACEINNSLNKDNRNVIIHAQFMNHNQLIKAKNLCVIPSFFNSHVYFFSKEHIDNFGYSKASNISPLNSAVLNNNIFTIHTDAPVTKPDILHSIYIACTRHTKDGETLNPFERINVYQALKAVTINAAYQIFDEERKGSIEVGKLANFTILDLNPIDLDINKLKNLKVIKTYIEGKLKYQY